MTGVTTGQTSLTTATDSDDVEAYSTGPLVTNLQALANLFESATGHDHSGAGKGKPVGSAGIASGVALTAPHFTSPVVDSGAIQTNTSGVVGPNGANPVLRLKNIGSLATTAQAQASDVAQPLGILFVLYGGGSVGIFNLTGGNNSVASIYAPAGWSNVLNTANTVNVAWNPTFGAGAYVVQNNTGATNSFQTVLLSTG